MLADRRSRRPGPLLNEELTTLAVLAGQQRRRTSAAVIWPGVGRFSENADKLSEVELVRLAKRCHLLDDLREETDFNVGWGRPREPGEAALAYLAFVHSAEVDIQPWWRDSLPELWWECGFAGKPRYELIYDRFVELEQLGSEAFFRASATLIRHAQEHSAGLVGVDMAIDCTDATSNVRLHHDCQGDEQCPGWHLNKRNRHGIKTSTRARLAAKADSETVKRGRQKINRGEFDPDADVAGDVQASYYDEDRQVFRVNLGGHWWRCRDATAGVRAITGKRGGGKAWTGFYSLKLVCRTFGTPVVHLFEAADIQEHFLFDEALERALHIFGEDHIRSISFDAGFAVKDVYRQCAEHGITGVGPFRRHKLTKEQERLGLTETDRPRDHDRYDRDGIPRCKYCGGETKFIKFRRTPKPRVWFSCARPGPECRHVKTDKKTGAERAVAREQSLLLDQADPRYVLPLWRNTAAYQALRELGIAYERAHALSAARSRVGTSDHLTRPKRIGVECQQLRANASAVSDWLKVLYRQGWLPQTVVRTTDPFAYDPPEDPRDLPVTRALRSDPRDWHGKDIHTTSLGEEYIYPDALNREQPYTAEGSEYVRQMLAERRREGLHRPYGKQAVKLGLGPMRPVKRQGGYANLDIEPLAGDYLDTDTGEVLNADQAEHQGGQVIPIERARRKTTPAAEANAPPPAHPPPDELGSSGAGKYGQPLDEPSGPA